MTGASTRRGDDDAQGRHAGASGSNAGRDYAARHGATDPRDACLHAAGGVFAGYAELDGQPVKKFTCVSCGGLYFEA
jgi:hypothetical protein